MKLTADQVSQQRFTPVRFREGYDMAEVDAFLDQVAHTLLEYSDEAEARADQGQPVEPASGAETSQRAGVRRCPVDGAELATDVRSGVQVDQCPNCRGEWLEAGRLTMLVAASEAFGKKGLASGDRPATHEELGGSRFGGLFRGRG